MNTFNLRLDLDKSTVVQVVTLRQGDTDGTTISATVYDHGALADLSGVANAYVEFALPDGEHHSPSSPSSRAGERALRRAAEWREQCPK